jgi:SSS family solute:Na+ symporter
VHPLDLVILALYGVGMLMVGLYFHRRQTDLEEYLVGGRNMGAAHIGLSVVATDVGGGFSIGLGGLGFVMGLSASWLLFTGLLGAWLSAVFLLPRVKALGQTLGHRSFPAFLGYRFGEPTRLLAAGVSAVGYAGFTGAQILAGATLAAAAFDVPMLHAVAGMSVVIVTYTALGGLEAVVYTDTLQWGVLFLGLGLLGLPLALRAVGGVSGLAEALPPEHLSLTNIGLGQLATWLVTIVPIWFVAMTVYQRIHATRDLATARRAWIFAGLLEYPGMAFLGAALGMCARVLYPAAEPEMGLPMLVRDVLPTGASGLVLAAYFAAIMSTADSCLLASVGNVVDDLGGRGQTTEEDTGGRLGLSRLLTVLIGLGSVAFALYAPTVIDSILLAYAFLVGGLFVPTMAALFWPRAGGRAAFLAILAGGVTTVVLSARDWGLGVEPIFVGLGLSALVLVGVTILTPPAAAPGSD